MLNYSDKEVEKKIIELKKQNNVEFLSLSNYEESDKLNIEKYLNELKSYLESVFQKKLKNFSDITNTSPILYHSFTNQWMLNNLKIIIHDEKTYENLSNFYNSSSISNDDIHFLNEALKDVKESEKNNLGFLIETYGGNTNSVINFSDLLITARKENIFFYVIKNCFSLGTIISLLGDTIYMHDKSSLGPIDVQLRGVPAINIKKEYDKIGRSPHINSMFYTNLYIDLRNKYGLEEQINMYITETTRTATNNLKNGMGRNDKLNIAEIDSIVQTLNDVNNPLPHHTALKYSFIKTHDSLKKLNTSYLEEENPEIIKILDDIDNLAYVSYFEMLIPSLILEKFIHSKIISSTNKTFFY